MLKLMNKKIFTNSAEKSPSGPMQISQPKTGHLALFDSLAVSSRNDYVYVIKTIIKWADPNKEKNYHFCFWNSYNSGG